MKTNKLLLFFSFILLLTSGCHLGTTPVSRVQNGVEIHSGTLNLKVQFYSDNIVRVTKWCKEGSSEKKSLSVIQESLPALNISTEDSKTEVILKSVSLVLKINKQTGTIEYLSAQGKDILKESGDALFKPVEFKGDKGFTVQQNFRLTPDEGVYGLGQHQDGYFNYRGKEVVLVQSNTEAVNPFLISTQNYGILWDNYSKTIFKDNAQGTSIWSEMGNNMDYYFISGSTMDNVISGYRHLTGTAPMYGKYAYGYWQSKEHYDTQEELLTVARKYRRLKIPIDNMIQDWDYWNGNKNWGSMEFDKTLFPEPEKMMEELHQNHFHAIISIWPAIGPNTKFYKEMEKHPGFLYPTVGWAGFKYIDAYNQEAMDLYCSYLNKGIYSKGLDGWWMDSTEPDVVCALTKESSNYELKKMANNCLGSFARYLNPYSLVMTEAVYKNWRNQTSEKRAFILTRSTFAGQQRNAATTWSGDIGANWQVYRNQISAGVNHCMSGIPYWTFDIGAFVLGAYDGVFNTGGKQPSYQELYTRMFQLGAFSPIFRSHGSETPREIWEMGDFTPTLVKFDNLRYRFMPYIYSQAWKVTSEDYTYMRGLPMDFENDKKTYNIDDQFMFGPSIMVNPVTEFMYHRPPTGSVLVPAEVFKTNDGKPGLVAKYYKTKDYQNLSKEQVDPNININWYGGRPDYVTDSMYSIRWEGKLVPRETGKYQFHMKSFDAKRIILDGKTLPVVYTSTEQYTDFVNLEAGKEYSFVLENENNQTGAARMILNWKTPSMWALDKEPVNVVKTREVYLPEGTTWYDFWTGKTYTGGQRVKFEAPIDKLPLLVKAGSIIPMGPFVEYSTQKPADPLEIRIYRGANGSFTLYEDENDNYNYEKGVYSTIAFDWDDASKTLTIGVRKGEFPGMLKTRTIKVILVNENHGNGVEIPASFDKEITYNGDEQKLNF
ncbi:MAG TPA: glycoside hydrolase family 31 protein [Prolixibacteraceae bacterium]|nr:glycoside hydrolase family 31 protein [Prolixibacteraceae bacterium]